MMNAKEARDRINKSIEVEDSQIRHRVEKALEEVLPKRASNFVVELPMNYKPDNLKRWLEGLNYVARVDYSDDLRNSRHTITVTIP
jgi:hypothetical protein